MVPVKKLLTPIEYQYIQSTRVVGDTAYQFLVVQIGFAPLDGNSQAGIPGYLAFPVSRKKLSVIPVKMATD